MKSKFLKPYNPQETEGRIYKLWEESGYFNPDNLPERHQEPFTVILPPPNVTGTLHTGHALMLAIEDLIVRFERMRGKRALWIPGTDHAAISTESVVVKQLAKDGTTKHKIARVEFLRLVKEFANKSHDTIVTQLKKMGGSLDWSREAFTLDQEREVAVYSAFKQMYDDGLIYRGSRIVNWDPKGQTTISDDEVDHEARKAKLYYFKYSHDFPITIATTRPETKFGDTAVAVHPEDERYKEYVGQTFEVDFVGVPISIKVIADESVDKDFGTGALGVTPAHSQVDWEIAQRHALPIRKVINEYAKMDVAHPDFHDKKTTEARDLVVEKLGEAGLLEQEVGIEQNVSLSQRTKAIIEPLPKEQWWIDVSKQGPSGKSLKELMLEPVRSGQIRIVPERFEKIYYNWIENLRDWNISRQIWYGHRIPVWHKNGETYVGVEAPDGEGWEQDPDTLDTWFSSGLWTFSTLGWPSKTKDLETYHPTSILETGHDILFFWVARMILMSQYLMGEVPFKSVYLHGMVLDKNGKKMSKSSPETAVDPLETVEKFGADALRMAMIVGVGPGQDVSLSEDKIRAYGKFANKLWNITRYVLTAEKEAKANEIPPVVGAPEERVKTVELHSPELINEFNSLAQDITNDIENYRFHLASEKIYHYVWHRFADEILEESKGKPEYVPTLKYILENSLKLLHPFMPFVTEEIWQSMEDGDRSLLMVEEWPVQ